MGNTVFTRTQILEARRQIKSILPDDEGSFLFRRVDGEWILSVSCNTLGFSGSKIYIFKDPDLKNIKQKLFSIINDKG